MGTEPKWGDVKNSPMTITVVNCSKKSQRFEATVSSSTHLVRRAIFWGWYAVAILVGVLLALVIMRFT